MSRELRFRAWQPHEKKMHQISFDSAWWDITAMESDDEWFVMQWTGLQDKNGTPIYESDICRDMGGSVGFIEWEQEECGWLWVNKAEAQCPFSECEVIGNQYQHPELLEGNDNG